MRWLLQSSSDDMDVLTRDAGFLAVVFVERSRVGVLWVHAEVRAGYVSAERLRLVIPGLGCIVKVALLVIRRD